MRTYPAGSQIPISDVGESTPTSGGALVCRTDRDDCCRNDPQAGEIRQGDWRYIQIVTSSIIVLVVMRSIGQQAVV